MPLVDVGQFVDDRVQIERERVDHFERHAPVLDDLEHVRANVLDALALVIDDLQQVLFDLSELLLAVLIDVFVAVESPLLQSIVGILNVLLHVDREELAVERVDFVGQQVQLRVEIIVFTVVIAAEILLAAMAENVGRTLARTDHTLRRHAAAARRDRPTCVNGEPYKKKSRKTPMQRERETIFVFFFLRC